MGIAAIEFAKDYRYARKETERLIRFAARSTGAYSDGVRVVVGNASPFAVYRGTSWHYRKKIAVRIGRQLMFPAYGCKYPKLKTAPVFNLETWQEAVVLVAAHEFRHQWQGQNSKLYSEIDAERFAVKRLQAYRKYRHRLEAARVKRAVAKREAAA